MSHPNDALRSRMTSGLGTMARADAGGDRTAERAASLAAERRARAPAEPTAGRARQALPEPAAPRHPEPSPEPTAERSPGATAPPGPLAPAAPIARRATLPPRIALARGRTARGVALAALGGFGVLFVLVRAGRSRGVDVAIARRLQAARLPFLAPLMRAVSWPGFPPQSRIIPPAIVAALAAGGLRTEAAFQTAAWGSALISTIVKAIVQRPRPLPPQVRVVVAPLGDASFPSGHVLTYMGVYAFLAYLVGTLARPARLRRALLAPLVALVALVGPSRIHQGHHWPTDVLASYLLGTSCLVGLVSLYRRAKERVAPTAIVRPGELAAARAEPTARAGGR